MNFKFNLENCCTVTGRKGLTITFDKLFPQDFIKDKSLVNLSGKKLNDALKKPFYLTDKINLEIKFQNSEYIFSIPEGYDWNGANVPPCCWLIIGQAKEPRFKLASCVHDYLCENKRVINYNRYLSTLIFEALCEYFGRFNKVKRWAMFHGVDNYQKLNTEWRAIR